MHDMISRVNHQSVIAIKVVRTVLDNSNDIQIEISTPLGKEQNYFPSWVTAQWVEDTLLATGKVQLSFVGNLVSTKTLQSLLGTVIEVETAYYDDRGWLNERGADVLSCCWEMVRGDGVIDLDLFLAIPEVAWLWLDLVTRSDCADAARRHHPWSGGFTIGGYLAKNYKVLCRLWYRDLFNTPS